MAPIFPLNTTKPRYTRGFAVNGGEIGLLRFAAFTTLVRVFAHRRSSARLSLVVEPFL